MGQNNALEHMENYRVVKLDEAEIMQTRDLLKNLP